MIVAAAKSQITASHNVIVGDKQKYLLNYKPQEVILGVFFCYHSKCASNCNSCVSSCTSNCNSGCTGSCASCTNCLICTGHCNACTGCHGCYGDTVSPCQSCNICQGCVEWCTSFITCNVWISCNYNIANGPALLPLALISKCAGCHGCDGCNICTDCQTCNSQCHSNN